MTVNNFIFKNIKSGIASSTASVNVDKGLSVTSYDPIIGIVTVVQYLRFDFGINSTNSLKLMYNLYCIY